MKADTLSGQLLHACSLSQGKLLLVMTLSWDVWGVGVGVCASTRPI